MTSFLSLKSYTDIIFPSSFPRELLQIIAEYGYKIRKKKFAIASWENRKKIPFYRSVREFEFLEFRGEFEQAWRNKEIELLESFKIQNYCIHFSSGAYVEHKIGGYLCIDNLINEDLDQKSGWEIRYSRYLVPGKSNQEYKFNGHERKDGRYPRAIVLLISTPLKGHKKNTFEAGINCTMK